MSHYLLTRNLVTELKPQNSIATMEEPYSALTKPELIVELKRRALKLCGNKPEMVFHLLEDDHKRKIFTKDDFFKNV